MGRRHGCFECEGKMMQRREWLALAGLACCAFVMNTSEFMPIGLLVDIASSFGMTEADAGAVVTIYAWAVALLSIPLMVALSRLSPTRLLLGVIALFCVGQIASALALAFPLLVAGRLLVAASHAVFWSVVSPVAVRIVGAQHGSTAIAVIAVGSSIAMVCGLPIGRIIGLAIGWRMTFACVAAVSMALLVYLFFVMPRLGAGDPFSIKSLPSLFRCAPLLGIYVVTALYATAQFTCYSYIEPFLQQVSGFSDGMITVSLALYGAAGFIGSLAFSRVYDRARFAFMRAAVLGVTMTMAALLPLSGNVAATVVACCVWGSFYTAYNVAFQAEVISNAPEGSTMVAMSAYSGIFNIGIGAGTWIGGVVTATGALSDVGLVGAAIGAVAFLVCSVQLIRAIRREDVSAV